MFSGRTALWALIALAAATGAWSDDATGSARPDVGPLASVSLALPADKPVSSESQNISQPVVKENPEEHQEIIAQAVEAEPSRAVEDTPGARSTTEEDVAPPTTAPPTETATGALHGNASSSPACAPHTCRMLCPFGFAVDERGCPLCECYEPCRGVECPGGHECHIDDSACRHLPPGRPCLAVPSCRRGRAHPVESTTCPFGTPLLAIGGAGRPLVCGPAGHRKPACPSGYDCVVASNAEYGVCCPTNAATSVGECPFSVSADFRCDDSASCSTDSDCDGTHQRCCPTSCGRNCLPTRNATLCEQQRRLAALFARSTSDGPPSATSVGYAPQCDPAGGFVPRQCSTNGLVCWCVDAAGHQLAGSIGPADSVACAPFARRGKSTNSEPPAPENSSLGGKPTPQAVAVAAVAAGDSATATHDCSLLMCEVICEFGYRTDERGCAACECIDPCEARSCSSDEECIIVKVKPGSDGRNPASHDVTTACSKKAPGGSLCASGIVQLYDNATVPCLEADVCDDGFVCEFLSGQTVGLCCLPQPQDGELEGVATRILSDGMVVGGLAPTRGDAQTQRGMFGDETGDAGGPSTGHAADVERISDHEDHQQQATEQRAETGGGSGMFTMCEYLRDLRARGERLAVRPLTCGIDGRYTPLQCDGETCFCVDDFGVEVRDSRVSAASLREAAAAAAEARRNATARGADAAVTTAAGVGDSVNQTATDNSCWQRRPAKACHNMLCRLGCDYGFEYDDDGCPMCVCHNPCAPGRHVCGPDELCQPAEPSVPCHNRWCPPVPKCISKEAAQRDLELLCPGGASSPLMNPATNQLVQCYWPRPAAVDGSSDGALCPSGYRCTPVSEDADAGFCCPTSPAPSPAAAADAFGGHTRQQPADAGGDGATWLGGSPDGERLPVAIHKAGQCPYLLPLDISVAAMSCEVECSEDRACPGDAKCCSNGCGTQCMSPVHMTGCEHSRTIRLHQLRAGELRPNARVAPPLCDLATRAFAARQCDDASCWCVDDAGRELPATRRPKADAVTPDCVALRGGSGGAVGAAAPINVTATDAHRCNVADAHRCNIAQCNVDCEFGQRLDERGCPSSCECVDPCDALACDPSEECRLVQLTCAGPCPRQAVCRPRAANPCAVGRPLAAANGSLVACGPAAADACPLSHKCQLDIFGEFAVCCPKPREVCFSAPPVCRHRQRLQYHNRVSSPTMSSAAAGAKVHWAAVGLAEDERTGVSVRWFYNSVERRCQPFEYDEAARCAPRLNMFADRNECEAVCPVQTPCELMREKMRTILRRTSTAAVAGVPAAKPVYVPKCNARLGTWEPVQCMYDLGLCWCVDQAGNQIAGSMVRGRPDCAAAAAAASSPASAAHPAAAAICPNGEPVHLCDADEVCGERICAAHSNATCRVNPCGRCEAVFVDDANRPVDCSGGLTACQEEAQQVVNSRAWTNQGLNTIGGLVDALRELSQTVFLQEELAAAAAESQARRSFITPIEALDRLATGLLTASQGHVHHELLRRVRRSPKVVFDQAAGGTDADGLNAVQSETGHDSPAARTRVRRDVIGAASAGSDEISDYNDPAARAMSAYHQNRRRTASDPIAAAASAAAARHAVPTRIVVPLRAPIVMVVRKRVIPPTPIAPAMELPSAPAPILPSLFDLMQAAPAHLRVMIRVPVSPSATAPLASSTGVERPSKPIVVMRGRPHELPAEPDSMAMGPLPGGVDPALFMSHVTSMIERMMLAGSSSGGAAHTGDGPVPITFPPATAGRDAHGGSGGDRRGGSSPIYYEGAYTRHPDTLPVQRAHRYEGSDRDHQSSEPISVRHLLPLDQLLSPREGGRRRSMRPHASGEIVVGPNFEEVRMTVRSETPVPAAAMHAIDRGAIDALINYLFGHQLPTSNSGVDVSSGGAMHISAQRGSIVEGRRVWSGSRLAQHVVAPPAVATGQCPQASLGFTIHSMMIGCPAECHTDGDCRHVQDNAGESAGRCCRMGCSSVCVPATDLVRASTATESGNSDNHAADSSRRSASRGSRWYKPGSCPSLSVGEGPVHARRITCVTPSVPQCLNDADCADAYKCCRNACGQAVCVEPTDDVRNQAHIDVDDEGADDGDDDDDDDDDENDDAEPTTMVLAPPVCSPDGGYAVSQSQGELSWCVGRFGEPLHETLTRGSVACDVNGTITRRESLGPVCPGDEAAGPAAAAGTSAESGRLSIRVCRDECATATCFAHPDAMCVANPCDGCRVHFVDAAGERVDCTPACEQKPFQSGARCGGSGDHHRRRGQPLSSSSVDGRWHQVTAPADFNRRRTERRFSFNATSQRCEPFDFECDGNDNNFASVDECEQQCRRPRSRCELPLDVGPCSAAGDAPTRWWYNSIAQRCEPFAFGGCGGNGNNFETRAACELTCPDVVLCPYDTITREGLTREPCDRLAACAALACPGDPDAVCQVDPCDCRASWRQRGNPDAPANCDGEPPVAPAGAVVARGDIDADDDRLREIVKSIQPKCLAMKEGLAGGRGPDCDERGAFKATQCFKPTPQSANDAAGRSEECWCVDAAGHQIGDAFRAGERVCESVKISRVDINLAFAADASASDVKQAVRRILRSVGDSDAERDVRVEPAASSSDRSTHAVFSIDGDNCANSAHIIEKLVMGNMVSASGQPANFRKSRFVYVADTAGNSAVKTKSKDGDPGNRFEVIYSFEGNEVLAVKRQLEPRTVDARTTTLAAAVLAVTVVMCILLLFTIFMHHRRQASAKKVLAAKEDLPSHHRPSCGLPPGTVAFQNPVYALWTNRVMSAVCRRSPVPSPPKSPDNLARTEAHAESGPAVAPEDNDEVDDEFNNPNYDEVIVDDQPAAGGAPTAASRNASGASA